MTKCTTFLTLLLAPIVCLAGDWTIDPSHSNVRFLITHMMISDVTGSFKELKGSFSIDEKDITKLKADAEINAASIDTQNSDRDKHLKNKDFFEVEKYPTIRFKSAKVQKKSEKAFDVVGELTMHGQTKPVTLAVHKLTDAIKDPWGKQRRGLGATAEIDRRDWGMNYSSAMVDNKVRILVDLELIAK